MRMVGMLVDPPQPRKPGVEILVTSKDKKKRLWQHYVVQDSLGYVLTLTAATADLDRYRLAFDFAVKHLEIETEGGEAAPEPESKPPEKPPEKKPPAKGA
jgi:hypothetical protein